LKTRNELLLSYDSDHRFFIPWNESDRTVIDWVVTDPATTANPPFSNIE
jgi:hypothetical protein